jgi:TP901 family phage tail tape measure protein
VAGEDFNISLGLDVSAATKELAAFVAESRKKARAVREELKSINFKVAPIKVQFDSKIGKELAKVEGAVARINKLKISIGDKGTKTSGLASEKVPTALKKASPSSAGTIQKSIQAIDDAIAKRQIALQNLLKSTSPGPVIDTQIEVVKKDLGKLQKQRRELTGSVSKQIDEIEKAQKDLEKLIESPEVLNAIKLEYEETKKANEARVKANRKAASSKIALLKELEKLERGPEVVAAMKAQIDDFKDVQKRTSGALKKMRKDYGDAKKQLDKTGSAADKKIVEDYVKKIKKTHEYLLWVTDELEVLSDASTSRNFGVQEVTKDMKNSRRPSESGVKEAGRLPASRSTAPLTGKQYGAINEAADKILKLARETQAARGAASVGTIFDNQMAGGGAIANFMIPALRLLLPNKVSQEQADKASKGQGGIAVILRDTKADFSSMIDELKSQLENTSDSETELRETLEDLIDEFGNYLEDDEKGSGRKAKGSAEAAVNSEFVKGDSTAASGSIVTASEDMARNLREQNESTKELAETLSLGSKSKDKKAGIYTISSDAASQQLSDEIAAVTAEELQMVFEAVVLAVQKANDRAQQLRAAGDKSILFPSTPLTKIKNNGKFWSSETTNGGSAERDEDSSDAAEEDKAGKALQLVPIGITQTEIEKGFDRGFAKLVKQILGLKETPSIGLDVIGPYGIRSADGTIEGAVGVPKNDSTIKPGSKDIAAVGRIIGPDSPLTKVIQNILQKVNEGLVNPKLEPQLSMLSEDFTPMEWKALGEKEIVDIQMSLGALQEEFLNTVLYFAALTQDNKIRTDTGQTKRDSSSPDAMSLLPGSSQSNPQLDTFFKLFNSTRTNGTKTITALNPDGSAMLNEFEEPITKTIKNVFDDFTEGVSPVVTALRYLSKVFQDIYKIPMAGNLGKTGKFSELGLPSEDGAEMTFGQAFTKNRQGFISDMLQASAPKVSVGVKDATDKAGGAELPIEKLNGILEKLDRTTDGPAYGLKGTMSDGSEVDVNNFILNEMADMFAKSSAAFTQDRITTDTGVKQGPLRIGPMDSIRAKYGETVNGLTAGLTPGVSSAEQLGADTAQGFIDGYEGKMEIESPSKRMRRSGDSTIDGLEEGLFEGVARLDKAGRELADSFHTGWSEKARVDAAELIQQLEKEGTDAAKARIEKGLAMMRSAPPAKAQSDLPSMRTEAERKRLAETGAAAIAAKGGSKPPADFVLSSQEEIQRRNAANLAQLDRIRAEGEDLLVALDIESTGGRNADHPRGGLRNRVFGYSAVAGAGELSREPGALPGTPVVTPKMTGISHGMLVPPKDMAAGGQLFTEKAAEILDLQGGRKDNQDVLKNLIKRITGLGYGKEKTTGSEQEYVKQLEDIAALLTKLYEEKIPLAIHSAQLTDMAALGKEFAHYGIQAPTSAQFRDQGLLVETQSMGKMLGGFMKDITGKVAAKVGAMYELFTGKTMGAELVPPSGNIPKLADASAVAHDPTIDTAATLVNAATMRAAAGQAGVTQTGLLGKKIELLDATWQKVSDAIWGARKFGSPGQAGNVPGFTPGGPKELSMWKRQSATHGGQLQPVYGPQQAPAFTPAVEPVAPAQDPQQAAQEAGDAAARQAKAIDALEKEKARIRKLKAQVEFQYQVDLVEQDMSVLKNLQAELNKPLKQGEVQKKQLVEDMAKLQATIDKKLKESSELADGIRRQLDANGGVRTLFRAKKGTVGKSDLQKQLEKEVKDSQKEIDAQLGTQAEAKPKSTRGPNSVIAAPLAELRAAEERIQASLTNAVSNSLGPALVSRLEQELAYIQKSIKTGPVGKRRMRDAEGNLTSAEVDVFKAEGVRGAKDRVAGKSKIESIKKGLLAELKVAEEKGRTETVEAVSKLIAELDASLASGPVGKYSNGRDAFELPDSYREKSKQEKVVISNVGDAKTPGAYDNFTHKNWIDQELDAEAKARKAASEQIKGQMKGEISVMAEVEKYNRKMMDSWISGRYALYDVANTYQQFQRVLISVGRQFQQAVQTFASFETSFTSVERAMQPLPDEFNGIRNEIVKLTGELPVAFDELSKIATLGAQMGIKANGITDFTEQVTKFSTITGLASDTVAQKFGRISQLAKVPSEDFNKLGSAVAFAGVNAVATDEEILTLTENIAAAASNSGFTADKIVGLATAMASLGIAPEQARGVITRLFGDINRAVEGGGAPLDAFAKQLGTSAEGAKELWKSDPQMFFKQMLDGLKGSSNMTAALDKLNIKETREVSTLQKLAGNMEVYNQAMDDAQNSYESGSFLSDAYGKTQDNLATKMELLNNQIKMLQDSFGQALAPSLGVVVGWMTDLLAGINKISQNPMAKWAMGIVTALGALVAVMVTYKMVSMKATASLLAFRTAQVSLSKIGGQESGIGGFLKMLTGQEQLIIRSNGRIEVATKKRIKEMQALGEINIAPRGSSEDIALRAGVDARRAGLESTDDIIAGKSGMRQATLDSNQDTIATLENTNAKNANTQATASNAAAAISESEAKTMASLANKDEIAAIGQEIAIRQAKLVLLENEIIAEQASIASGKADVATSNQIIAANQAEIASIQGEIVAHEAKQVALAGSNAATGETVALMTAGESVTNKFGSALTKLSLAAGAISVVLMAVSAISSYIESLQVNLEEAGGGLASFREAIYADTTAWKDGADAISLYESKVTTQERKVKDWAASMESATGSVVELDDKVSDVTDSVEKQTLALGANAKEWLAQAAMKDDVIQGKFESWANQGLDLDSLATQANVKISDMIEMALADPGKGAKDYLSSWFADGLIPEEYRDQLYGDLKDMAVALDNTTKTGVDNSKMWKALSGAVGATGEDLEGTGEELDNVAKKIYTLTNYVGDLSSIIGSAFTIRYGTEEAVDKVATSWKGVADRLTEAKKQMEAINQEIASMTADKNILEYQLNIALKYGDVLRADKIRAEIAAKNGEIVEKQGEYRDASQQASTSLKGMSPGAIANRETMRGMVADYNSTMTALANQYSTFTGKNQKADRVRIKAEADRLTAEFKAKALGLGFSENELTPYVKSFTDFKTIVDKLPNTLTLKVVADPGTRAFMEFWAASSDNPANATTKKPGADDSKKKPGNGQSGKVVGFVPATSKNEDLKPVKRNATGAQGVGGFFYDVANVGANTLNWFSGKGYVGYGETQADYDKRKGGFSGYDASGEEADYQARLATWNKNHKLPTGYKETQRAGLAAKHKKAYPGHYNPFDGTVNPYKAPAVVVTYGKPLADLASVHAAKNPGKFNPYTEQVNPTKLTVAQKNAVSVWKDAKSLADMGKEHAKLYPGEYNPYTHSVNPGVIDIGKSDNKQFADYLQHGATSADPMYVKNVNDALHKDAKNSPNNGWGGLNEGWSLKGYDQNGNAVYDYKKKYMGGIVGKYADGGLIPGNAPANKKVDNLLATGPNGMLAVRSGEYIQNQQAVKYYGVDFMNAINKMQMPRLTAPRSSNSASSAGNIVVELSSNAVMQLMAMSNRPINLYSDDRQIASSANRGNKLLAMRGSN